MRLRNDHLQYYSKFDQAWDPLACAIVELCVGLEHRKDGDGTTRCAGRPASGDSGLAAKKKRSPYYLTEPNWAEFSLADTVEKKEEDDKICHINSSSR